MKMITINGNLSECTLLRNVDYYKQDPRDRVLCPPERFIFCFSSGGKDFSGACLIFPLSFPLLFCWLGLLLATHVYLTGYCSTSDSHEFVLTELLTSFRTPQKPALPLSSLIAPQRAPSFRGASFKPQEANRPL